MGSQRIHKVEKVQKTLDHEEIFLRHHTWLLDRAMRLTNGAKEEAEDLVQDLYLRFAFSRAEVDLSDEDRLRGYLFKILKNLSNDKHRSNTRDPLTSLQTIDYDSMESALHAVDRSGLLHVRSDLAGICEYACIRRKSSRAGSVLIFRFFLGYYPSEIVLLLKSTPSAIHKLTETARLESKAFLTRPDSLRFLGQKPLPKPSFAKRYLPDDPVVLFAELRNRIFADVEGSCPTPDALQAIYAGDSKSQLTLQEVAHLASCQACLERANHLLRIASLPPRFPGNINDRHDDNCPPPPRSTPSEPMAMMRKRVRDAFEHRPKSLEVAVNGEVRGAQQVTSAQSTFRIQLKAQAKPKYIEVFSEQAVCLLYLDLENHEADEPEPIQTEIALSDDRLLSIEITRNGQSPVVIVSYFDPVLTDADESWAFDDELRYFAPVDNPPQKEISIKQSPLQVFRGRIASWLPGFESAWPLSVSIALGVAALLAVGAVFLSRNGKRDSVLPTAATLLAQSERSADLAIPPHGATRQTFTLEVRGDDGKVLESGTVETLRSVTPRRKATKLLNPKGKVVAGRWSNDAGQLTIYSAKDGLRHTTESSASVVTNADAWSHVPEAGDFDEISGEATNLSVRRDQDGYDLVYAHPANERAASLVSAELVLSGNSMRPISETIRLREGQKTREYRFSEVNYEILPASEVTESDFEPDATLSSLRTGLPQGEPSAAHLTLEALQLLNNLGPEVESIVNLERRPDGKVELSGVFPTTEQKTAVARVFYPLRASGLLTLDLHSSDEAAEPSNVRRNVSVESFDPVAVDTQRIPFDSNLRTFLAAEGLNGSQLDERIRNTASDITAHSAQLHRESWSICQIAAHDITIDELRRMKPDDQMLWVTLLDKHIRTFHQHMTALGAELRPLLHEERARLPDASVIPSSPQSAGELNQIATNLNHHSERLDRLLTSGFTLSPSSLPVNDNFTDIGPLLADLDREETALRGTIERLQTFGQADANK